MFGLALSNAHAQGIFSDRHFSVIGTPSVKIYTEAKTEDAIAGAIEECKAKVESAEKIVKNAGMEVLDSTDCRARRPSKVGCITGGHCETTKPPAAEVEAEVYFLR
jgi:hypothetical protein